MSHADSAFWTLSLYFPFVRLWFHLSKGMSFYSRGLSNPRWHAQRHSGSRLNEDKQDRGEIIHKYPTEEHEELYVSTAANKTPTLPTPSHWRLPWCVIDVCELKSIFYYQLSLRVLSSVSPGMAFIYSSDSRGIKERSVGIISSLRWKSESRNRTDVLISD